MCNDHQKGLTTKCCTKLQVYQALHWTLHWYLTCTNLSVYGKASLQPCTDCFNAKTNKNHSPVCYLSVLPPCLSTNVTHGMWSHPSHRAIPHHVPLIILMLPLQTECACEAHTMKLYIQAHPEIDAVCFNASVPSHSRWRSRQLLTLAGLFWADERLLFLSFCIHIVTLLLVAPGVFLCRATLKLALTLYTVPHAIPKVDQEAWEKWWWDRGRCGKELTGNSLTLFKGNQSNLPAYLTLYYIFIAYSLYPYRLISKGKP